MKRAAAICALLTALISPASSPSASTVERCTRTVNDVAWLLDHPDEDLDKSARAFARLFTANGALTEPNDNLDDETFSGQAAIAARYRDNRTTTRFLHVTSNIRVIPLSETEARGTSYTSFRFHGATGSMEDEGAITGLAEHRDLYQLDAKGCKIARRVTTYRIINLVPIITDPGPN